MKRRLLLLLALAAAGPAFDAAAGQRTLTLDPARTAVTFTLGATLHTVHGSAPLTRGVVLFDPAGGKASGEIVVDARAADTGNAKRDRDMHSKVLVSDRHPAAVLRPRQVAGVLPQAGAATLTVRGTLELLGREHEVTVPVAVTVAGAEVEISAELEVPYVSWGLEDPSKLLLKVDPYVTVTVQGVGTLSAAGDPPGPPSAEEQPEP